MNSIRPTVSLLAALAISLSAAAEPFELLTGVNMQQYPAPSRFVAPVPGPGFPGTFYDGDRLAGLGAAGPMVTFQGVGTPFFATNQFGATSFILRRGAVPVGGPNVVPFMGIEFLGGPLLDLDGDLTNGARSLIPVVGQTPVAIPGSFSVMQLGVDFANNAITIADLDSTGTNEGGPGIQAEISVTLSTIAGTTNSGGKTGAINPGYDTRLGSLTAFTGTGGMLSGVYRIQDLQFEFWNDTLDPNSSTAAVLGTLQQFVRARGWLIVRDSATCSFPTLTGQGLGGTRWPDVNTNNLGQVFTTANGLAGGSATIISGPGQDNFANRPAGLATGDIGAYLDTVVAPLVPASADMFVYLESAGFGINNSNDPIYTDSVQWDLVVTAIERLNAGDLDADGDVDGLDLNTFVATLLNPGAATNLIKLRSDLNNDCRVDGDDISLFLNELL